MQPCLSVVIATHNGSATLERALSSVAAQTPTPEIIVVDDGSDPEERAETASLLDRYPSAKSVFLPKPSGGPAVPRNEGVGRLATGDLLVFLDDDDEMLPGAVSQFLTAGA